MKSPNLSTYLYDLPDNRIAKFPLDHRDQSKLLYYDNGSIHHSVFKQLPDFIPENSSLFFNNTKVIPARIFLQKETGAQIEIFLLTPLAPSNIMSVVMEERTSVTWKCMIGNLKKWKDDNVLLGFLEIDGKTVKLEAHLDNRETRTVVFEWNNSSVSFAEIVEHAGKTPLPPYLNREATESDKPRYQTIYSEKEGAVAAPTAGLHFTSEVMNALKKKGVLPDFLTLHVSAGTFQPIKTENVIDHPMHSEQMVVTRENIENILNAKGKIIPVGTTSMRTLESLFWFGANLLEGKQDFFIEKLQPYQAKSTPKKSEAFQAVLDWMTQNDLNQIVGSTEIFIFPGYSFQVCDGLITNFHQPGSTLMLLVSALVGNDWKKIYDSALQNDYRFLSYGDSSLLLPSS